jgi:hypothetical protein
MIVTCMLLVLTCLSLRVSSSTSTSFSLMVRSLHVRSSALLTFLAGINAADITKLKSSGFYTVAVQFLSFRVSHSTDGD